MVLFIYPDTALPPLESRHNLLHWHTLGYGAMYHYGVTANEDQKA